MLNHALTASWWHCLVARWAFDSPSAPSRAQETNRSRASEGNRKSSQQTGYTQNETMAKVDLTAELLRRWFGDTMLQQPLHIADLQRASVVDLLRLLDYPNDYVPVLTRHEPAIEGQPAAERVDVVDKGR
jgi:hypothetical protein